MSSLQNFVGAKRGASPFQDRKKLAASARVSTKAKPLPPTYSQVPSSTVPPLGLELNNQIQRNTSPNNPQRYRYNVDMQEHYGDAPGQYTEVGGQNNAFDDTITSDFDATVTGGSEYSPKHPQSQPFHMNSIAPGNVQSNTEYSEAVDYGKEEDAPWLNDPSHLHREERGSAAYNRYAQQIENYQDHPSQPPTIPNEQVLPTGKGYPSTPAIAGRFLDGRTVPMVDGYVGNDKDFGEAIESPIKTSKKRSRNVDEKVRLREPFQDQPSHSKETKWIASNPDSARSIDEQQGARTGFEESILSEESSEEGLGDRSEDNDSTQQVIVPDIDYDENQLANMSYEVLAKETWDLEHHERENKQSDGLPISENDLKARFEGCLEEEVPESNTFPPNQVEFFTKLSIEQWEQTGDLFLDKFADLMKRMKASRQNKRQLVAKFERRIEEREHLVRSKSGVVEMKLNTMKKGGESVLRDVALNHT